MKTSSRPKNFFIGFSDFMRLIRANNLLIVVITQYLVNIFLIRKGENWLEALKDTDFLLLSFSTVLIAAAGYIINDYYDIKIDLINKPKEVVIGKIMKRRVAIFTHTFFNLVGIGIGFYLSKVIGCVNFFAAFWLWLYSNNLKRLPFYGNLSVAALTFLSVLVVMLYFREQNYLVYTFGVFAFFISIIREIIKDMEDMRGDKAFGCKTLPIVWGIKKTRRLIHFMIVLFVAITIILLQFVESRMLHGYFVVMVVPLAWFVRELNRADTSKAFKKLSAFCKWVMVSGMLAITLI